MVFRRAVTRFTGQVLVITPHLQYIFFIMAVLADIRTGIGNLSGQFSFDGGGPLGTCFFKVGGNNDNSDKQYYSKKTDKNKPKPYDRLRQNGKELLHPSPSFTYFNHLGRYSFIIENDAAVYNLMPYYKIKVVAMP